jgi:putative membrane protein
MEFRWDHFVNALVYAVLGILIYLVTFRVTDWISPYDLWKEIVEKHNMALAVLVGLMSLGIGIIIASAIN